MKFLKNISLLVILLSPLISGAQNSETDQKKVASVVSDLYRAMVERDKGTLENLTAEDLTYGHSSGAIENKSEYIGAVMSGPFEFISIDPADQTISISGEMSIVRHIFNAKGMNNGNAVDVHIGILMAFQKQDGQWKLLARQAYKL